MIPTTATALTALTDTGRANSGPGGGEGFLDALLSNLPAEAQGLSLQELMDWLREQGEGALAGLMLPTQSASTVPLVPDEGVSESDPNALLGLIMSSRQDSSADSLDELTQNLAAAAPARQGAADDAFLQLLQAAPAGETEIEAELDADAPLRVPVRHPEFSQAVGERLLWLVRNDVQDAKIRLDPPSLGPLEISVTVKDDRATVVIHAHHALTREVLEAEAPRLRGMLGDSGFAQVDIDVARDNAGRDGERDGTGDGATAGAQAEEAGAVQAEGVAPRAIVGLIDQYV